MFTLFRFVAKLEENKTVRQFSYKIFQKWADLRKSCFSRKVSIVESSNKSEYILLIKLKQILVKF